MSEGNRIAILRGCLHPRVPTLLFMVPRTWRQLKNPLPGGWVVRMQDAEVVVHCLVPERKVLPFAAICMDLEGTVPGEVGQPEKDRHCIISLTCKILNKTKLIETEIRFVEQRGGEGELSKDRKRHKPLVIT